MQQRSYAPAQASIIHVPAHSASTPTTTTRSLTTVSDQSAQRAHNAHTASTASVIRVLTSDLPQANAAVSALNELEVCKANGVFADMALCRSK
jgi:hypothetical protein